MGENGVKPTFDFTRVSRQWNQKFIKSLANAGRAQTIISRPVSTKASEDEIQAYYDRVEKAWDDLENLANEQLALIAQVLVSVPREWLLADAPDEIDWSKPESFDWIQSPCYGEILELLRSGEAQKSAKN